MSSETNRHPTVTVQVGPWSGEIDEQIAPLIREMWIAGIKTFMSCQEDSFGMVWINFTMLTDLVKFLDAVAEFSSDPNSMYNRINGAWGSEDPEVAWLYELDLWDAAFRDPEDTSHSTGPMPNRSSAFYFHVSVRFPPLDLPEVLERLRRFNNARNTRWVA